jgi:hypothetical protein
MRADESIDMPDPTLHAEFGSTALPGINEIHLIAVSAPGRPTAGHKRRLGLPLECRKLLDKHFEEAPPLARRKEPGALPSRGPGVSKPAMGGFLPFPICAACDTHGLKAVI